MYSNKDFLQGSENTAQFRQLKSQQKIINSLKYPTHGPEYVTVSALEKIYAEIKYVEKSIPVERPSDSCLFKYANMHICIYECGDYVPLVFDKIMADTALWP